MCLFFFIYWFSPQEHIAEEENLRLINITKARCRFTTDTGNYTEQCIEWNKRVIDEIINEDVDLVVTLADIAYSDLYDVPECIDKHGRNGIECKIVKDEVYNSPSAWDRLDGKPANVLYADYSDYFCGPEYCDPVVGNIIGYFDHDHMTETFSDTFTPLLYRDVMDALKL